MCGIFGVVSRSRENNNNAVKIFQELLLLSETRGKEASGFAIVDENKEKIFVHKVPYIGDELIKSEVYKDVMLSASQNNCFAGIGHSRLVTNGYEQFAYNNQPVIKDNFVIIHNGIIVNIDALWLKYQQYTKQTDLDTEIIPLIINHHLTNGNREEALGNILSLQDSLSKMYEEIEGVANIALLNSSNSNLVLASNNGSLFYGLDNKTGLFFFGSELNFIKKIIEKFHLTIHPEEITQVVFGHAVVFDYKTFELGKRHETIGNNEIEIEEIAFTENKKVFINKSLEHNFSDVPDIFINQFNSAKEKIDKLRRCSKCLLPETFPFIEYDNQGVCNYCNNYKQYKIKGEAELKLYSDKYRKQENKPEVLIGLSGGRDSCYALHYITKVLGLKAIAFSYDWGMLTDLARRNQSRMCAKLGVEHILISADIRKKRDYIHKNVSAWLKKPNLGTIPLFMAGDKQYFYYANKLMKENNIDLIVFGENLLEATFFKYGFCNIKPNLEHKEKSFTISTAGKLKMIMFYLSQYVQNPSYINTSLLDSFGAFLSFYYIPHNYLNLFHYLKWDEKEIIDTLINEYNWETDPETKSTWRIGDGTAAFYNYIYYSVAGFSEFDTFRSNQIREGTIDREEALKLVNNENHPRFNSLKWYLDTIGLEYEAVIKTINKIPKYY